MLTCRTQKLTPVGSRLLPLPLPVLRPGVHTQLPGAPALPVQQVGLLHLREALLGGSQTPGPGSLGGTPPPGGRWPRGLGTHPPPPSLQQGKMFFFIGLTMATIQGTYARQISPGTEAAAVKRVRDLPLQ